jgi:hypothetical protein
MDEDKTNPDPLPKKVPKLHNSFTKLGRRIPSFRRMESKISKIEKHNILSVSKKRSSFKFKSRSSRLSPTHLKDANDNLNNTEGFIMYAVALMYLSKSYHVSLSICNSNFKKLHSLC